MDVVISSFFGQNAWATTIARVDGGVVRRVARLPRIPVPASESRPMLMRRAQSGGIGLLVQASPGLDEIRDWYVLPVDPETGELDEPVRLFGSDLEGQVPERCSDDRDGWLVNTDVNTDLRYPPVARVVGPSSTSLGAIELRLRLDPGSVCVDAIAARGEGLSGSASSPHPRGEPDRPLARPPVDAMLPMVATEPSTGRKWLLRCGP